MRAPPSLGLSCAGAVERSCFCQGASGTHEQTENRQGVPMSRCIRLALATFMLATLTLPAAAQTKPPAAHIIVGTAEDRAAIEKLMWTYDRMLDTYNAEAYAKLF